VPPSRRDRQAKLALRARGASSSVTSGDHGRPPVSGGSQPRRLLHRDGGWFRDSGAKCLICAALEGGCQLVHRGSQVQLALLPGKNRFAEFSILVECQPGIS
jgi:hypothetical protein